MRAIGWHRSSCTMTGNKQRMQNKEVALLAMLCALPQLSLGCVCERREGGAPMARPVGSYRIVVEKPGDIDPVLEMGCCDVVDVVYAGAMGDADIEMVADRMVTAGYEVTHTGRIEGMDCRIMRFMAHATIVLETNDVARLWRASKVLWTEGVPFRWDFGMGYGLVVPGEYVGCAMELLRRAGLVARAY